MQERRLGSGWFLKVGSGVDLHSTGVRSVFCYRLLDRKVGSIDRKSVV